MTYRITNLNYKLSVGVLLVFMSLSIQAAIIQGKVISIADGDTLTILIAGNQKVRVRLAGIDAPEKAQPFGNKSKQALAALTFQKQAIVEVETKDRYGRSVGRVYVQGFDMNADMVRQGYAWVYRSIPMISSYTH